VRNEETILSRLPPTQAPLRLAASHTTPASDQHRPVPSDFAGDLIYMFTNAIYHTRDLVVLNSCQLYNLYLTCSLICIPDNGSLEPKHVVSLLTSSK
jgi:hypothetical protein